MQLVVKDDKLQKYRDHVRVGGSLSEKDKEMFDRFFFAFTNLLDGLSERKTVELLMTCPAPLGQLSQSQAYNVVNGAQEIFGALDFSNSRKLAQRNIYATRLEEIAMKLEKLGDDMVMANSFSSERFDGQEEVRTPPEVMKEAGVLLEKAANVRMKAAKIRGLMEADKVENPNKWKVAPNIIFTDDMSALDLIREIEDTEYSDVTADGGEIEEGETAPDNPKS